MKPEKRFSLKFRKCHSDLVFVNLEHNPEPGIPDWMVIKPSLREQSRFSFFELKAFDSGTRVKFQPGQTSWLKRHWDRGVSCYVLVSLNKHVWVISGGKAPELEESRVSATSCPGCVSSILENKPEALREFLDLMLP